MSNILPQTARTKLKRIKQRANYEISAINEVLDQSLFATIAFSDKHGIHAIPTAIWREDNYLYIHGSPGSRLLKKLQEGVQACVSVTLFHGLVLARSAFNHSMNYASVCIYGVFEHVCQESKYAHMQYFMDHWLPERWQFVRPPNAKELKALTILRIPITEAVLKKREGGAVDDPEDLDIPVWAGVLPLETHWGASVQAEEQIGAELPGAPQR